MKTISKSQFVDYKVCPRLYWLKNYSNIETKENAIKEKRIREGNEVGVLARQLFKNGHDFSKYSDFKTRLLITQKLINSEDVIFEASFQYDHLVCSVDILEKTDKGYTIYEVKASTKLDNKMHIDDIAFQKFVLEKCGLNIIDVNVVLLNEEYLKDGDIDVQRLFKINNVNSLVNERAKTIINEISDIECLKDEPSFEPISACSSCDYKDYCYRKQPENSILYLYNSRSTKNWYREEHLRTFQDAINTNKKLNTTQKRQIDHHYNNQLMYIDFKKLEAFIKTIKYPVYYLDFETIDYAIPSFDGTYPYQKLPVQYSLHLKKTPNDSLVHIDEYLANPNENPRKVVAERLSKIEPDASVIVYNASFEKGIISKLSDQVPEFKNELDRLADQIVDLLDVFRKEMVYSKEVGNSFSIKNTLPALCPHMETAYKKLSGPQNGNEAMEYYDKLLKADKDEAVEIRNGLLKYCELDTLAMYEMEMKLRELITNK